MRRRRIAGLLERLGEGLHGTGDWTSAERSAAGTACTLALLRRAPVRAVDADPPFISVAQPAHQVLTFGRALQVAPELAGHLRVNTLLISDNVRQAVHEGRADFTPCFLSEIPGLFHHRRLPRDVALVHISPPDEHGFCSFGVAVGLTKTAAQAAKLVTSWT